MLLLCLTFAWRCPRIKSCWLKPDGDGDSEANGGQKDRRTPTVAGRKAAPVVTAYEHDLDKATAPVAALAVFDWLEPEPLTWEACLNALGR